MVRGVGCQCAQPVGVCLILCPVPDRMELDGVAPLNDELLKIQGYTIKYPYSPLPASD